MAYILGYSGIAVSFASVDSTPPYLSDAASFVVSFIKEFLLTDSALRLFSINYPNLPPDKIKGIRCAPLARRNYGDSFDSAPLPDGRTSLRLTGEIGGLNCMESDKETDADLLKMGYITVTPLLTDCCDHNYIELHAKKEQNG